MNENKARDAGDVWDVGEDRVVACSGSTHAQQTNANLSEYVVYSVSINVMSDVFSNVKSGHCV